MNRWERVDQLYHAALELPPESRHAFLTEACAGDEALLREVAALVSYDDKAADFIESPAHEIVAEMLVGEAGDPDSEPTNPPLAPDGIGSYRFLGVLGSGGMGEVHLALDTRLNRRVAVKLLPREWTTDPDSVRRFVQEARAASALNHPNILTIHEVGQVDGNHYIVGEYVDGETLRSRMDRGRLDLAEAVGLAVQLATALDAAHRARVIHRDVKPENVMIRRDGYVKLVDFGLAKLLETPPHESGEESSSPAGVKTATGWVMGTPRSMSPEQARGEPADERSDVFSLGVLLYEMAAGRAPFGGETRQDVLASILKDDPPPLSGLRPEVPAELERIVSKALHKAPEQRQQSARELLQELLDLERRLLQQVSPAPGSRPAPSKKRMATAGLAAGTLAILAGWVFWPLFRGAPVLADQDTILLAEFENRTGESVFDGTLKHGLAIQLEQSPFLNLFPEAQARQALRLMQRPGDTVITAEVGREICLRHNLDALITGSIARLGSQYVITLEAIHAPRGETLAREQATAAAQEQVLGALGQAAARLRGKLGESLSSIQRFDTPLEHATTSNLEAFQAWALGVEHSYRGAAHEAVRFFRHAVQLDPEFAHAYSVLSAVYAALGRPELAAEHAGKGYALRDRVSEYEKLRIENFYHGFFTGNLERRIEVLKLQKRMYPREKQGGTDLTLTYNLTGRHEQAVAEGREAVQRNPGFAPARWALATALLRLDRVDEAWETLAQAFDRGLDGFLLRSVVFQISFIRDDAVSMEEQQRWASGRPEGLAALEWQAGAAAWLGEWSQAQQFTRQAIDATARGDTVELAARFAAEQALRGAALGDCGVVEAAAAESEKLSRGRTNLSRAALALALCGMDSRAEIIRQEIARRHPEDTLLQSIWLPAIEAAKLLRINDEPARALKRLEEARPYEGGDEFWSRYLRALAWVQAGEGRKAAEEFDRILQDRGHAPLSVLYPLSILGAARGRAASGEAAQALKLYRSFLDVWEGADPDLPILLEARREHRRLELAAR